MSPERFAKLNAALDARQPDLTVFMENVHKPHNLAAIARSGDAVGVGDYHCVLYSPRFSMSVNAASGIKRYVTVHKHPDLDTALHTLRGQGLQLVAAHLDSRAVDYREVDYCRPTALLVGMELNGLSEAAVAAADVTAVVPMVGMVQSLNVSVATALMLFEARRQRQAAGLYNACRLPPEQRQAMLFRWSYPNVADYCDRRGLPYPALDANGYMSERLADRPASPVTRFPAG